MNRSGIIPAACIAVVVGLTYTPATLHAAAAATGKAPLAYMLPCDDHGQQLTDPGYYRVTGAPGSTVLLYALVGNRGTAAGRISLVPVDARSAAMGGISLNLPGERRTTVGSWVQLSTTTVRTKPSTSSVVPFAVHVPAHTPPGQYLGALTAFIPARKAASRGGASVTIQTRVAVAIEVIVPGPTRARFSAQRVDIQDRPTGRYMVAHIENSGNMLLKGTGYLYVWKQGVRRPIMSVPLAIGLTVPHTVVDYPIRLPAWIGRGTYTYNLALHWNGGEAKQRGGFRI